MIQRTALLTLTETSEIAWLSCSLRRSPTFISLRREAGCSGMWTPLVASPERCPVYLRSIPNRMWCWRPATWWTAETVEYAHLQHLLRPLRRPLFVIPGNHDERSALRKAFGDCAYLPAGSGFLHYPGPY